MSEKQLTFYAPPLTCEVESIDLKEGERGQFAVEQTEWERFESWLHEKRHQILKQHEGIDPIKALSVSLHDYLIWVALVHSRKWTAEQRRSFCGYPIYIGERTQFCLDPMGF